MNSDSKKMIVPKKYCDSTAMGNGSTKFTSIILDGKGKTMKQSSKLAEILQIPSRAGNT
jgi:hypothetical protein